MSVLTRIAAGAALLAMPLSLTACGSSGDKPSKADVQTGLSKLFKQQTGASVVTSAQLTKLSSCMTDRIYDKVSTSTLKAVAGGNTKTNGSEKDKSTMENASTECAKSVVAGG